jgi:predicted Zn-dependent peptidase
MEEAIRRTVLPNGIRVISQRVPSVYSLSLGFWFKVGSNDESKGQNGLAHLLEHMTFKGTRNRSTLQIAQDIESIGGTINAFTSRNATCYYVHLLNEHLPTGIEVLADLVQYPVFDNDELEKEKQVILEEIREIEDDPGSAINDYFDRQIFPDHPIGRPILGTIETVESFTRDNLLEFRSKYYTADRMVVVGVGNLEHEQLVDLVEKSCSELPLHSPKTNLEKPKPIKERSQIQLREISQGHLILGRRIFPRTDRRRIPLSLLNTILCGGMSSRFFQNIRNRHGSVYDIFSFYDLFLEGGIFGIYAGVDANKMNKMKGLILKELEDLSKDGITEKELQKAQEQAKGSLVISLESMFARMNRLAQSIMLDKSPLSIQEALERIKRVTVDDINTLAQYLYQPEEFIETIFLPTNGAKNSSAGK